MKGVESEAARRLNAEPMLKAAFHMDKPGRHVKGWFRSAQRFLVMDAVSPQHLLHSLGAVADPLWQRGAAPGCFFEY